MINKIIVGDCYAVAVEKLSPGSVDLIVTSPPYAGKRMANNHLIAAEDYLIWFLPRSEQLLYALKNTGSFVLNIKEGVENGERQTYVLDLILALKQQGWLWTEEYIWHKRNCAPGKWPNRFRDAWERCLHFTKQKKFYMDQEAVMVPTGDWAKSRLKKLSETDQRRDESKVASGFGKRVANWVGRDKAFPSNVLHFATECGNKNHSAAFPMALPEFFIKLFSKPGDTVLDPFCGSGTTCVVAKQLGRRFIGIDISKANVRQARKDLGAVHTKSKGKP